VEAGDGNRALTERQAARRDRVLKAAIALASSGGYDAVQMRDVAAKARVALGTLYRYFSSKDHLLVSCLGQWTKEFQQRIDVNPPTGDSPADRVVDVLQRAARALERSPNLMAAFVTGLTSLSSEDPVGLAEATTVYSQLHEFVTNAMDGDEVENREAVVRVIGEVWLATLIASVRGWARPGQMAEDLEAAVRLLLHEDKRSRRPVARARA
jgi:TetR/AcrR family transcriptional regulator, cholesterol catabolism regulator